MYLAQVISALYLLIPSPPPQYNHPFNGELVTTILPSKDVWNICENRSISCAVLQDNGKKCIIFIPKVEPGLVNGQEQKFLIIHETAHCNGWPANHKE